METAPTAPFSFAASKKSILSGWGRNNNTAVPEPSRQKSDRSQLTRGKSSGTIDRETRRQSDLISEQSDLISPVATLADVQELREAIKLQTHQAKDSALIAAKEYADQHMKKLEFSVQDMVLASGAQLKESLSNQDVRIEDVKTDVEQMKKMFAQQIDMLEQQVRGLTLELLPATNRHINEVSERLQDSTSAIHEELDKTAKTLHERTDANNAAISSVSNKLTAYMKEDREEASAVTAELEKFRERADEMQKSLSSDLNELRESLEQLRQKTGTSIDGLCETSARDNSRLLTLEERTIQLFTQSSQILSMPVRRVEWVLRDASQFVESAYRESIKAWASRQSDEMASNEALEDTPWRCWFSPEFEASGANGLQLELQVFPSLRQSSSKQEKIDGDSPCSNESNECILRFWAPKGVYMHFKLHVGHEVMELQHEFDGDSPCSMKRCLLNDAFDSLADTLHFGVDVLEVFQGFDRPSVALSTVRGKAAIEDTTTDSIDNSDDNPRGSLRLYNHMCPGSSVHLGKIEEQLNLVKSRLIGRVEWVLQDAATMPDLFTQGEYLCSPVFTASGAEGLQLIFFPSGEAGATACWCSLYLYYPGRTQLQCWLWVGKQRREITHAPRDRPGFFGRVNFAIYQMVIDQASDSLTLAVEICDVQTAGNEIVAYEPAPRAVPWPQKISYLNAPPGGIPKILETFDCREDANTDEEACPMNQPQVLEHTSRLYGKAGRLALHDVKTLPSMFSVMKPQAQPHQRPDRLWSFQPKQICSGPPEGYIRCNDLRPPRQETRPVDSTQPPRAATSLGNEQLAPIRRTPCSPRPNSEPLFDRAASPYTKPLPTLPKDGPAHCTNRSRNRGRPGPHSRAANQKSTVGNVSPSIRPEPPLTPCFSTPRAASACDASPTSEALLASCG